MFLSGYAPDFFISYKYTNNSDKKREICPNHEQIKNGVNLPINYYEYQGEHYPLLEREIFVRNLTGGGSGALVYIVKDQFGMGFVRKYDSNLKSSGHGLKALASEARTLSFLNNEGIDDKGFKIPYKYSNFDKKELTSESSLMINEFEKIKKISDYFPKVLQRGVILKTQDHAASKLKGYIFDQEILPNYRNLGECIRENIIEMNVAVLNSEKLFNDLFKNGYTLNIKYINNDEQAKNLFYNLYTKRVVDRLTDNIRENLTRIELKDNTYISLKELFNCSKLTINGTECKNPLMAMHEILNDELCVVKSTGWSTHGDLNISNILANKDKTFRLIDIRELNAESDPLQDLIKHQFGCNFSKILDKEFIIKHFGNLKFEYLAKNLSGENRILQYKENSLKKILQLDSFKTIGDGYPNIQRRLKLCEAMQFLADIKFGIDSPRAVADFFEAALLFKDLKT